MGRTDPVGDLGIDPAWLGVVASIVGFVSLQALWGPLGDMEVLTRMGAWTAAEGPTQPWRLLSYGWLHGSWDHMLSNVLALIAFGWPLERVIGWRRWTLLYVLGVLAGGVTSVLLEAPFSLAGASAGVFAMWAAMAALAMFPRQMLHSAEVGMMREALWPLGLAMALQSLSPGVSWAGHLGGFLVGATAGLTGLLVVGLEPRAPKKGRPQPVSWVRAIVGTFFVGVFACGFPLFELVLLGVYVLVVCLVAWSQPRYAAQDGWGVTLAALAAGALLWSVGLGSVALGRAWDPQPGAHWIALDDDLPAFRVPFRSHADIPDGLRFGRPEGPYQVDITFVDTPDTSLAERWSWLLKDAGPGELHDGDGCPSLDGPGSALVLGPEIAVRLQAFDDDGPVDLVWQAPEGCPALTLQQRLDSREARRDHEGLARLRAASFPDDVAAQLAVLAFDLPCPERVAALAEHIAQDASLAVDAAAAAVNCPDRQVVRWLETVLKADPDDGRAWLVRADVAEQRGNTKTQARALREAERTTSGDDLARVRQRLAALDE